VSIRPLKHFSNCFLKMSALAGLCFAITGTLSVGRSEFEDLITSNGGEVAKSVTKKCTHLVRSASINQSPSFLFLLLDNSSAVSGTKKCEDAEAKGLTVVDEDWVRDRIKGGGASKKVKAAPAAAPPPAKKAKSAPPTKTDAGSGGKLSGMVFAITGGSYIHSGPHFVQVLCQ
jgi:BRCT domain type II-containing protein